MHITLWPQITSSWAEHHGKHDMARNVMQTQVPARNKWQNQFQTTGDSGQPKPINLLISYDLRLFSHMSHTFARDKPSQPCFVKQKSSRSPLMVARWTSLVQPCWQQEQCCWCSFVIWLVNLLALYCSDINDMPPHNDICSETKDWHILKY